MRWQKKDLIELEELNVITLGRGRVISRKDIKDCPGNYPVYSSSKTGKGEFGHYGKFDFDEELITWSVDGGGHLFYRPKHRFSITNVGGWLRIKRPEILGYKFMYYQLELMHSRIRFDWVKKAHPSVLRKEYRGLVLPPLDEQERIVEVLDEAFAAIDKAKANIERNLINARELFQSRLNDIFSNRSEDWEVTPLGEVCDVKTGPFGSMLHKSEYSKDGVPVVNPADFAGGSIAWNSCKRIPKEKARVLEAFLLVKHDVVIGRRGEIGRNAVFQETIPALCGTGSFIVRPNNKIDPEFLHFQLNSPVKRVELESRSSGATMKNLSSTSIKSLRIAVPSNAIQKNVVGELRNLSAICSVLEKKYREESLCLEELRQSILEKAFEGKLTEPVAA